MQKNSTLDSLPEAPITKQYISQFLPMNPVIVEAGAHRGRDTIKMAKLWPQGSIYAFEPVPELFTLLTAATQEYPNIHCSNKAISNSQDSALLYISGGASNACSSLLKPKECLRLQPTVQFEHTTMAQTITLDSWAQEHGVCQIDFMWLDMQGNELKALEGARSLLFKIQALFIEVNLVERYENCPSFTQIYSFLQHYNFIAIQRDMPKHNKINVLFVQKQANVI